MSEGLGEFGRIRRFFAPLAGPGGLDLRDDAALLDCAPGHRLVVTVDAIVAGVHYLPEDPPDLVARKLLRVNLSDLAAMGARPRHYLLTTALPRSARSPPARKSAAAEPVRAIASGSPARSAMRSSGSPRCAAAIPSSRQRNGRC